MARLRLPTTLAIFSGCGVVICGPAIVRARAGQGSIVGWGQQVVGGDAAQGFTGMISGGDGAGLITLDPDGECSLELSDNVILNLTSAPGWDGGTVVQINSDDNCALCGGGAFQLHAPATNIVGNDPGYCFAGDPMLDTIINPGSPVMPEPPPCGPARAVMGRAA